MFAVYVGISTREALVAQIHTMLSAHETGFFFRMTRAFSHSKGFLFVDDPTRPGCSSVNMMTEIGRESDHSVVIHHDCDIRPSLIVINYRCFIHRIDFLLGIDKIKHHI